VRLERILPERWHGLTLERIVPERWRGLTLEQILPKRWHGLTKELAKFGTIGVINLFVNFAVFNLLWLTVLRSGEVKAKAIATIVATTCAYFMNRHWTYRDRPKSTIRREYSLFFFFNAVGLLIEVTVVGAAKYGFGLTHIVVLNLAGALGILLGTIFRFWAYRTHVFRPADPDLATESVAVGAVGSLTPVLVAPIPTTATTVVEEPADSAHHDSAHHDSADQSSADGDEADHESARPATVSALAELEDMELREELTQLELDDIVAKANRPVRF
jgi:putative flippase GtrA